LQQLQQRLFWRVLLSSELESSSFAAMMRQSVCDTARIVLVFTIFRGEKFVLVLVVHVALVAVLVAVAVAEEVVVALEVDSGLDDGLVDAIRGHQVLADRVARNRIPSAVVHVAVSAEVDLVEVIHRLVDKDPCNHRIAAADVAEPVVVVVVGVRAAAAADVDDVAAAELVVVQQLDHPCASCSRALSSASFALRRAHHSTMLFDRFSLRGILRLGSIGPPSVAIGAKGVMSAEPGVRLVSALMGTSELTLPKTGVPLP
ncbi:hypothetical protein KCU62_g426, partial [Aureobasidium sp. EXF-3399]